MARVNVDDASLLDPRLDMLSNIVGDRDKAIGMLVRLWRLGTKYWADRRGLIPKKILISSGLQPCIEAEYVSESTDGFFYCHGAKERFEWYYQVCSKNKQNGQIRHDKAQGCDGGDSVLSQSRPVPSPVPDIVLNTKKNTKSSKKPSDSGGAVVSEFISCYCESFKKRYTTNPVIDGKSTGIAKRLIKSIGLSRAKTLVQSYLTMNDQWFITKAHDLQTFEGSLNKIEMHNKGLSAAETEKIVFDRSKYKDWDTHE